MFRAKHVRSFAEGSAKDAEIGFNKKSVGWGLCELGVLGARKFLAVALSNISEVRN
jgi:hypothetical protein